MGATSRRDHLCYPELMPQVRKLNTLFLLAQILSHAHLEGGNTPFPFQGCSKRNHPCLHTLSQMHMELLARWQMACGNLARLVGEALTLTGKPRKPGLTAEGDTPQDREPWVWSGYLSTWTWCKGSHVQINSDTCCSPTPKHRPCLPMEPVPGLTICSFSHTFLSQPGPQNPSSLHHPLSRDRCFCLGLAKPGTWPSFNLFPSKWQKNARQRGVLSWGEGKSNLSDTPTWEKLGWLVSAPGHGHREEENPQSGTGTEPLGSSICPTQAAGPQRRVFWLEQARYPGAPCITSSHCCPY